MAEEGGSEGKNAVWSFLNSSFGLWLLSAIFITGAGSLFTKYQNAQTEAAKKREVLAAAEALTKDKIERIDIELSYRLSSVQQNLDFLVARAPTIRKSELREHTLVAVEPLFVAPNSRYEALYPEFSTFSGVTLVAELRRHLANSEKEKMSEVITALSGLKGELGGAASNKYPIPEKVASQIIGVMGAAKRWDQGFFYTDCSKETPFC